jgi:peptidyl-prolyl cis-trans isomerase SurA
VRRVGRAGQVGVQEPDRVQASEGGWGTLGNWSRGIEVMTRTLTILIGWLLLTGVATGADILEQVLVKVNGDIITKTDLEQRQIATLRQKQPNLRPDNQAALQKALAEITPEVIVDAVDELLITQRGKELGYTMTNDRFNSILESIKKENKIESDEQFQAALKQEGMTLADLRKQLERTMMVQQVQQTEVMGKIQVTDPELRAYYDAHKEEFATKPEVTLREILVAVPANDRGVNVAQDEEARAKAEDLRKRILAGEPAARLAADFSDSGSKANGGLIGPLSLDQLSPELQKELGSLVAGDVTPVIRTSRGYQVLKVEGLVTAKIRPYEDARDEIADRIANQKRRGEFEKFLTRLRSEAIIDWKNDEIKKAYEIGLQQTRAMP